MAKNFGEEQKKAALIIILAITFLSIDFSFILKPQIKSLNAIALKRHQSGVSFGQYKDNSPYVKNLRADFQNLKNKSEDIEKNIFSDSDMALLLDFLSQKALSCGIKIIQIKPQSLSGQKEEISGGGIGYAFFPLALKLQLNSGYHQLGVFLSQVEENPLISVEDLRISASTTELTKQITELTLTVYVTKK